MNIKRKDAQLLVLQAIENEIKTAANKGLCGIEFSVGVQSMVTVIRNLRDNGFTVLANPMGDLKIYWGFEE